MSTRAEPRHRSAFARESRTLITSWLALLALLASSLSIAYLHLGVFNLVASLAIAAVKTAIVGWWFMHLRASAATSRIAIAMSLFLLAILLALSGVDYVTRLEEPAAVQQPQQIEPLIGGNRSGEPLR